MKLFDFLKEAQGKIDDLQKKIESGTYSLKKATTNDDISKQILVQRDSLKRNGFKEYAFIANRDCCGICARLNGKHFPISKIEIGVNAPPMHDGCKCSIAAYEDNDDYEAWLDHLDKGGTTADWKKSKKK